MGHFDLGLFIWAIATFGVLLLLLAKFAFKPLRSIVEQREAGIRESVEAAEKARDEARQLMEQQQQGIAEAHRQAGDIIEAGRKMVEQLKQEAHEQSRAQTEAMVNDAKAEIERENRQTLDELKQTVASLSVRISRQVIRENLDEDKHLELADQFIERLKKTRHADKRR